MIFVKNLYLKDKTILILSFFYVTIFAGVTYYFIYIDNIYFVYILLICAFSDIGGYVFGKIFKWKKLTKISPKKTLSGVLGSFIFSLLSVFIIQIIVENLQAVPRDNFLEPEFFFLAVVFSLVSQAGDLTISYFKRLEKIKDTGKILPGHGGIFDRILMHQGETEFSFRDTDHYRINDLFIEGVPDFSEMSLFYVRKHLEFDTGKDWQVELLVRRQVGAVDSVFTMFKGDYQPIEDYITRPVVVVEEEIPLWKQVWIDKS